MAAQDRIYAGDPQSSEHGKTETHQHGEKNASQPKRPDEFSAGWVIGSACAAVLGVVVALAQSPFGYRRLRRRPCRGLFEFFCTLLRILTSHSRFSFSHWERSCSSVEAETRTPDLYPFKAAFY